MRRILLIGTVILTGLTVLLYGDTGDVLAQVARDFWGNRVQLGVRYREPNLFYLRAGAILAAGFFGFVLGWFLSPQAAPLRRLVSISVGVVLVLVTIADNGWLGWGLTPLTAFAAFCIGIGYWLRRLAKEFGEPPTTFGSAKFADTEELNDEGIIGSSGIRLGAFKSGASHLPLHYTGDQHGVVVGATRTKKGTSFIIPNLLSYEGSTVITDIKGENAMVTAEHRKRMGQQVKVVDPFGITGLESSRYNPLDFVISGGVEAGDNAMILAASIVKSQHSNDKFWDEEAKNLILGIMLHVALDPSEEGQRHLPRARDLLLLEGDDIKSLLDRMRQSAHPMVRSSATRSLQKDDKLFANILTAAQAHTHFLDSPAIRENLSFSDFNYEDLKTHDMSVYLVLPADKLQSHAAFLRLHLEAALTMNARNIEVKPEKPVLFILDEMPAVGRLPMVETAFGLMAGFGIQLLVFSQSAAQLKAIYKDNWETFISNAGFIQYLGSQDEFTSEYFSKLCGLATVRNFTTSIARAFSRTFGMNGSSSESQTTTDNHAMAQRRLVFADELRRMNENQQLILVRKCNPIVAQKQDWFTNPEFKDLGVNLYDSKDHDAHAEDVELIAEAAE